MIPNSIKLDRSNFDAFATSQKALEAHKNKRVGKISDRIREALFALERQGEEGRGKHSDDVVAWNETGALGPCPSRQEPPLNRLFKLFNRALPSMKLEFDPPNLYAMKGSRKYGMEGMSDGERQVLAILADIAMLASDNAVIIVDEPELNMHPHLAEQLWTSIEADLPNCIFVYATHSIGFAMRQGVDRAFVLSSDGQPIEFSNPSNFNGEELRPFLGAVPAILRAKRALVTEGNELSFDAIFYPWVLGDTTTEVIALGDCNQVIAATQRDGIWDRLARSLSIAGVIGRDFRSITQIREISKHQCKVLDLHEAESYLCVPELLIKLVEKLKLTEPLPNKQQIEDCIFKCAESRLMTTVANRAFARASLRLAVSVHRKTITTGDETQLRKLLRSAAEKEAAKVSEIDPDKIEKFFNKELNDCKNAIETRSIDSVLKIFPGKELLPPLARLVGVNGPQQVAIAVTKHFKPDDFTDTKKLQQDLQNCLSPGSQKVVAVGAAPL